MNNLNYVITGAGRIGQGAIKPYIYNANRNFSPGISSVEDGDAYRDTVTVGDMTTYVMTRLADGREYTIQPVATPDGTAYDTEEPIYLFADNPNDKYPSTARSASTPPR